MCRPTYKFYAAVHSSYDLPAEFFSGPEWYHNLFTSTIFFLDDMGAEFAENNLVLFLLDAQISVVEPPTECTGKSIQLI